MNEPSFLQQSLRIRYEAFSSFATAVSRAITLETVAQAMAVHAKYVLDVYKIRFYYRFEHTTLALEIYRGKVVWQEVTPQAALVKLEQDLLLEGVPRYVQGPAISKIAALHNSFFDQEQIKSIYTLPLQLAEEHQLVMTVASKTVNPFTEPDFRFIRLIAEQVANKFSQLLLMQHIGSKNAELAEVNHELLTLNEEVRRLNLLLEEKVEERTLALQQANEELNTIFYRTSHDFRRPLTTILGLSNIAGYLTQDKEVLKLFGHAQDTAKDLIRMLEKLKDLSEYAAPDTAGTAVDFERLLQRLQTQFSQQLTDKEAKLQLTLDLDCPFMAPEELVYPILENLLENSLFFSREVPVISLRIAREDNHLLLEVADNGQGIPAEYQSRVFDMYVRANLATKGNGLGLYVVKKLTEKLRGGVQLRSRVNEGTTVQIRLPLQ